MLRAQPVGYHPRGDPKRLRRRDPAPGESTGLPEDRGYDDSAGMTRGPSDIPQRRVAWVTPL
jgi:hypothetical protein